MKIIINLIGIVVIALLIHCIVKLVHAKKERKIEEIKKNGIICGGLSIVLIICIIIIL